MMKFVALSCVVLVLAIGSTQADEPLPDFVKAWRNQCIAITGVPQEIWGKAFFEKKLDVNNRGLQCYTSCMWMQHGAYREDGSIDMNIALGHVPEELRYIFAEPLIHCEAISKHDDICKRSMLIYECLIEVQGEYFQFV